MSPGKPNVFFILLSGYPTNMAYGVTTKYSSEALEALGYKVTFIIPKKGSTFWPTDSIKLLCNGFYQLLLNNKLKSALQIRFIVFQVLFFLNIITKFRRGQYIFWSRDMFISLLLSLRRSNFIICEIHRSPRNLSKALLQILKVKRNVCLAPITSHLQTKLKLKGNKSVVLPMSIPQGFLDHSHASEKLNIISYVGNYRSGKEILDLNFINSVAEKIFNKFPDWIIEVIGIPYELFKNTCVSSISQNLLIFDRLIHAQVFERIIHAKIGLVIYPNKQYFLDSFPLKIVEYSAARVALVVSDTPAHRNILNNGQCLFFPEGNVDSLVKQIGRLILDSRKCKQISEKAFFWVKDLTYENRVNKAISFYNNYTKSIKK